MPLDITQDLGRYPLSPSQVWKWWSQVYVSEVLANWHQSHTLTCLFPYQFQVFLKLLPLIIIPWHLKYIITRLSGFFLKRKKGEKIFKGENNETPFLKERSFFKRIPLKTTLTQLYKNKWNRIHHNYESLLGVYLP